jgi:hypothetical protein
VLLHRCGVKRGSQLPPDACSWFFAEAQVQLTKAGFDAKKTLESRSKRGSVTKKAIKAVATFLNRLLGVPPQWQVYIFDGFQALVQEAYQMLQQVRPLMQCASHCLVDRETCRWAALGR